MSRCHPPGGHHAQDAALESRSQFGAWSNDPRLSDAEIATIKTWVQNGKPEGDPKDMPAPSFPDGWKVGKPDAIIAIPEHKLGAGSIHDQPYGS